MTDDDKTPAERAAEERFGPTGYGPGDPTVEYFRQCFLAGWEARPVLPREQIARERRPSLGRTRVESRSRLLAQGDVSADREAAIRADQRERDAQIAEAESRLWDANPEQMGKLIAAAIRKGNNHA